MTAYVYSPYVDVPAGRYAGGTTSGFVSATVWGAGILATTLPIRIIKVENSALTMLNMYEVSSASLRNSSIQPTIVPSNLHSGVLAPPPTCAVGESTVTTSINGSTGVYTYSISGNIPTGTLKYVGSVPAASAGTAIGGVTPPGGLSPYEFSPWAIIAPGNAFWIGSDIQAFTFTSPGAGTAHVVQHGGAPSVNSWSYIDNTNVLASTNIYFDELRLQPSY